MYSLIIVDYNGLEKTIEYTRLCKQHLGSCGADHIVIVQNGEPEREWELLEAAFGPPKQTDFFEADRRIQCYENGTQQILYCHTGENMGYARGNNLGAKIAKEAWKDPYYLVSNNDLDFDTPPDLSVIGQIFAAEPEVGVIGPRVVTPTGEQQSPRKWMKAAKVLIWPYWIGVLGHFLSAQKRMELWDKTCNDVVQDAESGYYAWVSGCFLFIRAEAFEKAGMFDPHTFLYAEEMILSKRMEAAGYKVYFCKEAEVVHKHGQTTKNSLSVLKGMKIALDANCYFYETYMGVSKALIALAKGSFRLYAALMRLVSRHK